MTFLGKLIHRFVAHIHRGAVRQGNTCLFFQFHQFIIELIIFIIAHDLPIFGIIALRSRIQLFYQIFDPVYLGRLHIVFLPLKDYLRFNIPVSVRSVSSSPPVTSRHSPGFRSPRRIFMTRILFKDLTFAPQASHIRRICLLTP